MKKLIAPLCVLFSCLGMLGGQPSSAQMFLEQGKVSLTVTPGKNVTGELVVHNTTDQALEVSAYWEDFRYVPPFDGTKEFLPAGSTNNSLASWVHFSPQKFTLPAFGKKTISYIFNVPEAISGGYYGVLFLEKAAEAMTGKGIQIVTRVGGLFFLEAEQHKRQAVLDDMVISPESLQANFKNTGDVILIPKGVFYVLSQDGRVVDRGEMPALYLPPAEQAPYHMAFHKDFADGQYTIVATIDLQKGHVLVKEIDFEKTPDSMRILAVRD